MKIYSLFFIAFILPATLMAQTRTGTQTNNSQTKTTAAKPAPTLSNTSDSLKMAVTDIKTSFNTLFGNKRDTIAILIRDIDYDDESLALLKETIKKLKGVRSVEMRYKSASAMLAVSYKGKSTDLWDQLPVDARKAFKLVEAGDNTLTLQHKDVKAVAGQ
jgi:hypothetical protein